MDLVTNLLRDWDEKVRKQFHAQLGWIKTPMVINAS
jgi:hypothetical protein